MLHPVLSERESELRQLADAVQRTITDTRPASLAHNNWSFPGIDRDELVRRATGLADWIDEEGGDELPTNEELLRQYPQRLQFLRNNTLPNIWANPAAGMPVYLATLDGLERALRPALTIDVEQVTATGKALRDVRSKIRGMRAGAEKLEPTVATLENMAKQIVQAHEAADQLPTDLATLQEAREEIQSLRDQAAKDRDAASKLLEQMKQSEAKLKSDISVAEQELNKRKQEWDALMQTSTESAKGIIDRCEDAMRTSTSFGLAGAFHEQARLLTRSMIYWVAGLIVALCAGAYFGGEQLHQLSQAIQSSTPPMIIWTRLFLSLLSVGAPVWFAWLATKQIGQRFRLAEDYAYKASISRAYEGYRREAVLLDADFQTKLFSTALARLDEQPLRFVEQKTHGSPWHELLDSDVVKEAIKIAPDLAGKITQMAREKVEEAKQSKAKPKAKPKAEPAADAQDGNQ